MKCVQKHYFKRKIMCAPSFLVCAHLTTCVCHSLEGTFSTGRPPRETSPLSCYFTSDVKMPRTPNQEKLSCCFNKETKTGFLRMLSTIPLI